MKEFKDILKKIYQLKFHIIFFTIAFLFFFIMYFPKEQVIKIILNNLSASTGTEIIPTEPSMTFFPSLGIDLKSATIKTPDNKIKWDIGETSLSIPLTSIITFSPAIEFRTKAFNGEVNTKILGLPLRPGKQVDEIYIDLESKKISLNELIKNQLIDVDAVMDLSIQGNLNLVNAAYSDLDITSTLSNIQIKEGNIMGFPIPATSIKKGELAVAVSKNEVIIAKMNLGATDDDLNLFIKGTVSLKINNPYDLNIKIKVSGTLAQQFGSFLGMLPAQAKNSEGFYNIRVRGDKRSPIPQITPLQ